MHIIPRPNLVSSSSFGIVSMTTMLEPLFFNNSSDFTESLLEINTQIPKHSYKILCNVVWYLLNVSAIAKTERQKKKGNITNFRERKKNK